VGKLSLAVISLSVFIFLHVNGSYFPNDVQRLLAVFFHVEKEKISPYENIGAPS